MSVSQAEFRQAVIVNTLRSCQLFTGLPSPDLDQIAAITTVKAVEKGAYLFREGDPAQGFYIVQNGAVNVHRVSATGKEQIIHIFRTGDSFAEVALASDRGTRRMRGRWNPRRCCWSRRRGFFRCSGGIPNWPCAC